MKAPAVVGAVVQCATARSAPATLAAERTASTADPTNVCAVNGTPLAIVPSDDTTFNATPSFHRALLQARPAMRR